MTDAEISDLYNERAAIREYEGGARRGFAEQRAAAETIKAIRPQEPPFWLVEIARGGGEQERMFDGR